jgi:hypothetical protein
MSEALVERIKEFADLRWPDRDLPGRLRKLGEEVGELGEAICNLMFVNQIPPEEAESIMVKFALEVADCAIILQDMLIVAGCQGTLADYMAAKMKVNEYREWPETKDGTE